MRTHAFSPAGNIHRANTQLQYFYLLNHPNKPTPTYRVGIFLYIVYTHRHHSRHQKTATTDWPVTFFRLLLLLVLTPFMDIHSLRCAPLSWHRSVFVVLGFFLFLVSWNEALVFVCLHLGWCVWDFGSGISFWRGEKVHDREVKGDV